MVCYHEASSKQDFLRQKGKELVYIITLSDIIITMIKSLKDDEGTVPLVTATIKA